MRQSALMIVGLLLTGNLLINPGFEQCANGGGFVGWTLTNGVPGDDTCIGGNNGHNGSAWAVRLMQHPDIRKRLTQAVFYDGQAGDVLKFACWLYTYNTPFPYKAINLRVQTYAKNGGYIGQKINAVFTLPNSEWIRVSATYTALQDYHEVYGIIAVKPSNDGVMGRFILLDDCTLTIN